MIVSYPKTIDAEYRFVVVDGRIITGSRYRQGGRRSVSSDITADARRFADMIVEYWPRRESAYILDIGEYDRYAVVEANPFCCSGFYACDKRAIVDAINKLARVA